VQQQQQQQQQQVVVVEVQVGALMVGHWVGAPVRRQLLCCSQTGLELLQRG
jgi:hypothetical protein